jgi:putative oxidoreductase
MLSRFLAPHTERVYALLRILVGFLMAIHGGQKFGLLGPMPSPIPAFSQVWIGGWIELIGGLLVMIGLFTVPAAFVVSGTMAVAYIQFHWKLQLGAALLPMVNKGEMAFVYCFLFLFIACKGPGLASVDLLLARRRSTR